MNFPKSTEFNKKIKKQQFYENLDIPKSVKTLFVEQVKAVYWQNKLSEDTINIASGETVQEIEIFRIELYSEKLDESVLKLIDKGIPYNIIFVLDYDGKQKLCARLKEVDSKGECYFYSKYYYTEWREIVDLEVNGLSFDNVYESFIRQIAGKEIYYVSENLKEDISRTELRIKLEKEIARLEKQARAEKQPKKKFELVQKIKDLQKGLM